MLEFAQHRYWVRGSDAVFMAEERHQLPRGFDSCDWRWGTDGPLRGPHPAFWKFVCHSACHWLVDLNLFVAVTAWPKVPWRILNAKKHSTVWNSDLRQPLLFDANFLALEINPGEALNLTWNGVHRRPGTFIKSYLHHQKL